MDIVQYFKGIFKWNRIERKYVLLKYLIKEYDCYHNFIIYVEYKNGKRNRKR